MPERPQNNRINLAVSEFDKYGHVAGEHHLRWVVDRMLRHLLGDDYETHIAGLEACWGTDYDPGIPP